MNTTASFSSEPSWSRRGSTETIFSIQGKETDFVRDTTDTEWVSSDGEAGVEYEPVSESDRGEPTAGESSGDSDNEIISTKVIEVSVGDDGELQLADSELTASSSDSEMDLHDYWLCAHCRAQNNNPLYRYCEKCFKERKNFFPPRPKRKRKRMRSTRIEPDTIPRTLSQDSGVEFATTSQEMSQSDLGQCSQNSVNESSQTKDSLYKTHIKHRAESADRYGKRIKIDYSDSETDFDSDSTSDLKSPIKTSNIEVNTDSIIRNKLKDFTPLNKTVSDSETNIDSRSKSLKNNADIRSLGKIVSDTDVSSMKNEVTPLVKMVSDPALTVEDSIDVKLTKKVIINTLKEKLDIDSSDNLCIVCLVEPKSGVFVHGRIAHICCCYKCAVKVWSKAKRCPVCNCKVSNVLKAVVM